MASSLHHHPHTILLLISFFSVLLSSSGAPRHRHLPLRPPRLSSSAPPTTYFEVSKPINHPNTPPCSYRILQHDFAITYGKPPISVPYTPPTHCNSSEFSSVVLEWKATSRGRQFDRIFGVWLAGVELIRSCTAEPRPNGIVWRVEKDITKYSSLLMANQTLSVFLRNIVDKTYTGVYHVEITIRFYPGESERNSADLIVPISRNPPLAEGFWFEIENSTDSHIKPFAIPANAYRAVLEVYVSFHENDEFWYTNLPNEYLESNNRTDLPGNGPFREVLVSLDKSVVGAIWPFTVIYTGGVNPLLWRPISGIGSFNLPTYDIEITPFLGNLLDGRTHEIGFSVTNALNVWYIDANLHLWLDRKSSRTSGRVLISEAPNLGLSTNSDFNGLNGNFIVEAKRSVSSIGWVKSSHGKITTSFNQEIAYSSRISMAKNLSLQIVNQTIQFDSRVSTNKAGSGSGSGNVRVSRRFPLYMYTEQYTSSDASSDVSSDDGYFLVTNVTLGIEETEEVLKGASWLRNVQNGEGSMFVKGNLVQSGVGSMDQVYEYESSSEPCYYRSVGSRNYTVVKDEERRGCGKKRVRVGIGGSSSG